MGNRESRNKRPNAQDASVRSTSSSQKQNAEKKLLQQPETSSQKSLHERSTCQISQVEDLSIHRSLKEDSACQEHSNQDLIAAQTSTQENCSSLLASHQELSLSQRSAEDCPASPTSSVTESALQPHSFSSNQPQKSEKENVDPEVEKWNCRTCARISMPMFQEAEFGNILCYDCYIKIPQIEMPEYQLTFPKLLDILQSSDEADGPSSVTDAAKEDNQECVNCRSISVFMLQVDGTNDGLCVYCYMTLPLSKMKYNISFSIAKSLSSSADLTQLSDCFDGRTPGTSGYSSSTEEADFRKDGQGCVKCSRISIFMFRRVYGRTLCIYCYMGPPLTHGKTRITSIASKTNKTLDLLQGAKPNLESADAANNSDKNEEIDISADLAPGSFESSVTLDISPVIATESKTLHKQRDSVAKYEAQLPTATVDTVHKIFNEKGTGFAHTSTEVKTTATNSAATTSLHKISEVDKSDQKSDTTQGARMSSRRLDTTNRYANEEGKGFQQQYEIVASEVSLPDAKITPHLGKIKVSDQPTGTLLKPEEPLPAAKTNSPHKSSKKAREVIEHEDNVTFPGIHFTNATLKLRSTLADNSKSRNQYAMPSSPLPFTDPSEPQMISSNVETHAEQLDSVSIEGKLLPSPKLIGENVNSDDRKKIYEHSLKAVTATEPLPNANVDATRKFSNESQQSKKSGNNSVAADAQPPATRVGTRRKTRVKKERRKEEQEENNVKILTPGARSAAATSGARPKTGRTVREVKPAKIGEKEEPAVTVEGHLKCVVCNETSEWMLRINESGDFLCEACYIVEKTADPSKYPEFPSNTGETTWQTDAGVPYTSDPGYAGYPISLQETGVTTEGQKCVHCGRTNCITSRLGKAAGLLLYYINPQTFQPIAHKEPNSPYHQPYTDDTNLPDEYLGASGYSGVTDYVDSTSGDWECGTCHRVSKDMWRREGTGELLCFICVTKIPYSETKKYKKIPPAIPTSTMKMESGASTRYGPGYSDFSTVPEVDLEAEPRTCILCGKVSTLTTRLPDTDDFLCKICYTHGRYSELEIYQGTTCPIHGSKCPKLSAGGPTPGLPEHYSNARRPEIPNAVGDEEERQRKTSSLPPRLNGPIVHQTQVPAENQFMPQSPELDEPGLGSSIHSGDTLLDNESILKEEADRKEEGQACITCGGTTDLKQLDGSSDCICRSCHVTASLSELMLFKDAQLEETESGYEMRSRLKAIEGPPGETINSEDTEQNPTDQKCVSCGKRAVKNEATDFLCKACYTVGQFFELVAFKDGFQSEVHGDLEMGRQIQDGSFGDFSGASNLTEKTDLNRGGRKCVLCGETSRRMSRLSASGDYLCKSCYIGGKNRESPIYEASRIFDGSDDEGIDEENEVVAEDNVESSDESDGENNGECNDEHTRNMPNEGHTNQRNDERMPEQKNDAVLPTQKDCKNAFEFGANSSFNGPIVQGNYYNIPPPDVQPTKEDVELNRIWDNLKTGLINQHQQLQIPRMPWLDDKELSFKDYYIDLTIEMRNDNATRNLKLHKLFKESNGTSPTRILIEGPASYGKTTLAAKLCYDHATGVKYMRRFDVVILLRLREFEENLDQLITNTLSTTDYSPKQILEVIKIMQSKILFILDGFDELPQDKQEGVLPLLRGNQMPLATVITTSRIASVSFIRRAESLSAVNLLQLMHKRILIKGLTGNNRIEFLRSYLHHTPEKLSSILTLVKNKFASLFRKRLFDCPLYLVLLVVVAENADISTLKTKTDLYKLMFNFLLQKMSAKGPRNAQQWDFFRFNVDNPPEYVRMLSSFGSLATRVPYQYTFTLEEIWDHCGNDDIIKLGILSHNDSKSGPTRKSWYEPVHLTFLEFAAAYHFWVSLICTSKLEFFFNRIHIFRLIEYDYTRLSAIFFFGLCGKQLVSLCANLGKEVEAEKWLLVFSCFGSIKRLTAECQISNYDFMDAFTCLVPKVFFISDSRITRITLLRDILNNALRKDRMRSIVLISKYSISGNEMNYEQRTAPPIKVNRYSECDDNQMPMNWDEVITHQKLKIVESEYGDFKCKVKICHASVDEQMKWLSNVLLIQGMLVDKPIRTITYKGFQQSFAEMLSKLTELIRYEKVENVTICCNSSCVMPTEEWNNFLHCANRSRTLLDIAVCGTLDAPLLLDFASGDGKKWRRVELEGNVMPCIRDSRITCSEPFNWDISSFLKDFSSAPIEYLRVRTEFHSKERRYLSFRNNISESIQSLHELYITIGDHRISLQALSRECLNNLQVLAVAFTSDCKLNEERAEVSSSLVSVLSHCPNLMRLEFWEGSTDEFLSTFFQSLLEVSWSATRYRAPKATCTLNAMMLSHEMAADAELSASTITLLTDLLVSRNLSQLWLSCGRDIDGTGTDGYATLEFVKHFSQDDRFVCEPSVPLEDDMRWWPKTQYDPSYYMKIFKVT